ncbi:MAG: hypothetical protein NXI16_16325 [Alphaproteobacteria bacterium]|nr:hypothetical protein [Alphaproteobacteria bacterium]
MANNKGKPKNGAPANGQLSKADRESLKILAGTVRKNLGVHPVSNAIGNAARTGKREDYDKAAEGFDMLPGAAKKVVASDAVTEAHVQVQTSKLNRSIQGAVDQVIAGRKARKVEEKKQPKAGRVDNAWDFQNIPTDPALRRKMKKRQDEDWDPLDQGASWDWKTIPGHKK